MKTKNRIFAFLILCMAGSSCVKEKLEEGYNKQEASIDTYISGIPTVKRDSVITDTLRSYLDTTFIYDTTFVDGEMVIDTIADIELKYETEKRDTTITDSMRVVYNNGATRLVRLEGSGPMLESHGSVSFYYAGYTFSGKIDKKNLFVTNHQPTAESANFILTDPDYSIFEINLGETELLEGLRNGLIGVRAGEECDILFSGKYAFGNTIFGTIPANSALAFQIWVVGVSND